MGWKWNDIAEPLTEAGGFTDEQLQTVTEIVTAKKWALVDILEGRVNEAMEHKAGRKDDYNQGRRDAFREVLDGIKPGGQHP